MNLRLSRLAALLLLVLPGCPSDEAEEDTAQATEGESNGPDGDIDCPLECSGHGQCVLKGGLPDCECDDGFDAQGLDCVDPNGLAEPPEDFACSSPGDLSGADAARFISQGWSYVSGNTSCERGSTDIFRFRGDGVFTRHHQSSDAIQGGNFDYGCWTLQVESSGALGLQWDPLAEDSMLNCGFIAGLEDPPNCEGSVLFDTERNTFVLPAFLEFDEVHLLYSEPETCVWCTDNDACCTELSLVEANGELLCE